MIKMLGFLLNIFIIRGVFVDRFVINLGLLFLKNVRYRSIFPFPKIFEMELFPFFQYHLLIILSSTNKILLFVQKYV